MSLRVAVFVLASLFAVPVFAQERPPNGTVPVQQRVRADKKLLVDENMGLTEAEAKAFWPIYEGYQQELDRIYTRMTRVIVEYVKAYTDRTLTDEQARTLTAEVLDIDDTEAGLAKAYAVKLDKVLPGKKVARYLQIERKIRALLRCDLADSIPLVK